MHISGRDNPKIKLYCKLANSKKARREEGLFVLEGARLCADAFSEYKRGKLEIYAAFACVSALEKYSQYIDRELFDDEKGRTFFTIDESIAEKMSDTKGTQGIFIIARSETKKLEKKDLMTGGKYLILDNLQDPGNVGTIIRTADAVGISGVIMCADCCELYNPKVIRSAMGSVFRTNVFESESFADTVNIFKESGISVFASVIDINATSIVNADFGDSCAVVIGNEGNGMSDYDAAMCDEKITIKMCGNINSLNAAMASGIILWEMCRGDSYGR